MCEQKMRWVGGKKKKGLPEAAAATADKRQSACGWRKIQEKIGWKMGGKAALRQKEVTKKKESPQLKGRLHDTQKSAGKY